MLHKDALCIILRGRIIGCVMLPAVTPLSHAHLTPRRQFPCETMHTRICTESSTHHSESSVETEEEVSFSYTKCTRLFPLRLVKSMSVIVQTSLHKWFTVWYTVYIVSRNPYIFSLLLYFGQAKGKTKMENLAKYFHLPINNAGKQLGICPTVLKKICRKHGIQRWPHRKVRRPNMHFLPLKVTKHGVFHPQYD